MLVNSTVHYSRRAFDKKFEVIGFHTGEQYWITLEVLETREEAMKAMASYRNGEVQ